MRTNPTPADWRRVRIIPDGSRFSVVTIYCRNPFHSHDLQALGLPHTLATDSVSLTEALVTGGKLERAILENEAAVRKPRR